MLASWMLYLLGAWVVGAYVAKLLPGWGLGPVEELRRTFFLLLTVFAGTTAMLFWGKAAEATSRFTLTLGFLLSIIVVPSLRTEIKRILLRREAWGVPVVIYGKLEAVRKAVHALREERGLGYHPAGVFLDEPDPLPRRMEDLEVLGSVDQFTTSAPIAILAANGLSPQRVTDLMDGPLANYRRVVIVPDMTESPTLWVRPRDFMGLLGIEIPCNLLDPLARVLKRTLDLSIVILTAPLWVPISVLLSLLIWLEDRKSPIFRQERIGIGGRVFYALKFRTMHPDAERILRERLEADPRLRAEWEANFKLKNDPRITRMGRFLRATSLDELPQFINVLRGEMSLVGPRPLPRYHHEALPERARQLRERVRPGITGLWQVSGRSEAGHAAMPRWDTYYVRNWSIWLDIVILVRTIRAVLSQHGAY
ncbi:MAG: undecaprenyl-phosphate galactose phosphotransferase WbaP [Kiritimatiellae bacterium]|nr:undecaprenyl-phosphate galactose phosphotransferase WbaP [Kiritimatiellia bacterium]MDW8457625.1 undecaprenyl-phosphate galactose phosphotransferase WbaP [Verrucomicrobiota bacterium]